ncbi:hypothetical protein Vretimale_3992 [Volvox reticuliferus]|uniref:CRAL-TRIO domain-containing protein n=1 Tax=Volvox reticuliferus TaxID=1737510 RepID=A0A8J4C646_9CHLO|nr:hypothetical protein Vretifemale_2691 [Volvox reticuliferus]GIL98796.1 hypothetical protein Vretimale_3992 [Volvox reticuliferus]
MSWFSHAAQPVQTETEAFWYLNLTSEQQAAYDKLLEHLKETRGLHKGHDDRFTLLRFLKARQWDVHRAAAMYQNMVKWRIEQHADHLYETFMFPEREEVLRYYPHFYHNTDKYGRPIYIELLGQTDPSKILEATTLDRLMHYHVCDVENLMRRILPACSVLAGRPIITKSVILDMKGVSMKTFGSAAQKILKTAITIDQDYYCETLGQMFIVNTPTVFRVIWAVVNPLLEERTRRKIVILGSDFLPTITQLVPLERLPTCLGGSSEVPEGLVSIGPWMDVQLSPSPAASAAAASPAATASVTDLQKGAKGARDGEDQDGTAAACGNGGDGGGGHSDLTSVDVKATTMIGPAPGLHQSATAPGRLARLGDEEEV